MRVLPAAAVASAAAWAVLAGARGRFWTTAVTLPPAGAPPLPARSTPPGWPAVVAVVPARDEAEMLPRTLPPLVAQDYPGRFHVVVVDDHSADATGEVAARLAAAAGAADRLDVVTAAERPPGWAGKVWAMREGLRYADRHRPRYLLLTDADIVHPPDSLRRLVAHAESADLDLTSLMVLLRAETAAERLVVPAFVYFFAQLYPFGWVNRHDRRTAAAAGGCVLIRRAALAATGDFGRMSDALIDDVTLARLVQRDGRPGGGRPGGGRGGGGRLWLGLTVDVVSARPYPALRDLWDMVARTADTQLRHSTTLLAGTVAGLGLVYVVPPAATVAGAVRVLRGRGRQGAVPLAAGGLAWATMTASYLPMVRHYRLPRRWAATLPVAAVLYLGMTLDSAVRHRRGRGGGWKGRTYGPDG